MDKPFKSVAEQAQILKQRNLQLDMDVEGVLLRCGYYNIINGYKDVFIASSSPERFLRGTKFSDIYRLYLFDSLLREEFLRWILRAEITIKNIIAYEFSKNHPEDQEAYLDRSCYSVQDKELIDRLLVIFRHKRDDAFSNPAGDSLLSIKHYLGSHGSVPLWIAIKPLTFGQVYKLFCALNERDKRAVSKSVAILYEQTYGEKRFISTQNLTACFERLRVARNRCAHSERIYCSRFLRSDKSTIGSLVENLKLFLSREDYELMLSNLESIKQVLNAYDPSVTKRIFSLMGEPYDN